MAGRRDSGRGEPVTNMDIVKSSTALSGEALDQLHRSYMKAPFNRLLGIEFGEYHDDGGVTLQLALDERHQNGAGVVHGGVMLTLADAAVSYGIARSIGSRCTTVEIKINYLRPVTGGVLTARSHLVRAGRRLVVARGEVHCESKQVAEVLSTFALLD